MVEIYYLRLLTVIFYPLITFTGPRYFLVDKFRTLLKKAFYKFVILKSDAQRHFLLSQSDVIARQPTRNVAPPPDGVDLRILHLNIIFCCTISSFKRMTHHLITLWLYRPRNAYSSGALDFTFGFHRGSCCPVICVSLFHVIFLSFVFWVLIVPFVWLLVCLESDVI